jgi:hypothetical protein
MTKTHNLPAGSLRKLPTRRENVRDDLVADYVGLLTNNSTRVMQLGQSWIAAECERRGARLETTDNRASTELDLLVLGEGLGFSLMAEHWSSASARLKIGGVLLIAASSQGAAARLADTLFIDTNWAFEDMIGGEVAVFRRIRKSKQATETPAVATRPAEPSKPQPTGLMAGVMRTLFKDRSAPLNRTR